MITHFHRFTTDNPSELEAQIDRAHADLRDASNRNDDAEVFSLAASLGSMLTTARREAEACSLLMEHLASARQRGTPEQVGWLLLFLATANQYLGRRDEASEQFAEVAAMSTSLNMKRLHHFTLHHWGRFYVEAGETRRSVDCFQQALALRVELNDPKQASTRKALEAVRAMANENDV